MGQETTLDSKFTVKNCKYALILGAGDIGSALTREIARANPGCRIFATKRVSSPTPENLPESVRVLEHDPISERSWQYLVKSIHEETKTLGLIISTIGVLHNDHLQPEKKLEDINIDNLREVFSINTFTAVLAAKNLLPFLSRKEFNVFAFLSDRTGSIQEDNLGGWYSYRGSKTALNMFVKNMAIEFKNRHLNAAALAINPGSTDTKLSRPYLKGGGKIWTPDEAAAHVLNVIEETSLKDSGRFENWDGSELPF